MGIYNGEEPCSKRDGNPDASGACGLRKVILDGQTLTLPEEMELDLGAVGKGYAGDLTADLVKEHGLESALLNIGGNIQAVGSRPDGEDWRLASVVPTEKGRSDF